ncbi:MAG TPA: hypothetical protein VFX44_08715 [Solirubrobacterales bacterium]|nr:hypothetical protein [Solirubrobacterales bacterium]
MRKVLFAAVFAAVMVLPASAFAAPHSPTGAFARFNDCKLSNPNVDVCLYAETSAGTFTLGKKAVPVKKPVVLQGGIEAEGNIFGTLRFVGAEDGNSLTKVPQPVPGGLLGVTAPTWWPLFLQNLFNETINNGFTGVNATLELAGPPSGVKLSALNILTQSGIGLSLPVKVHLENPFLGSSCYIGSNSSPIVANLTSGTTSPPPPNTPITGSAGEPSAEGEGAIVVLKNNKLVDNSFAAPGANGCGGLFSFLIDPFVNSIVGVPSPAGTNTAILEGTTWMGLAEAVKASEP